MKRKLISAILIALLLVSFSVPVCFANAQQLVYDEAGLLTGSQQAALSSKLEELSRTYNAQIVVYTVPSIEGGNVDRFTENTYDQMGFGYGTDKDGVLLLVCMDPREYRILSNGYASTAIDEIYIDGIGDMIVDDLSAGNYAEAFDTFAEECRYYLDGYINGFPFNFGFKLITFLIIGFVVSLIVTAIMKGQLKSVSKQDRANAYVKSGSLQLTGSSDLFLYRTVTRTKKEQNNSSASSGSGRSSRSMGGGKF